MPEFAFDLWSGGPVLGLPGWVLLGSPGPGQLALVGADAQGASGRRGRTLGGERAAGAGAGEGRGTTAGLGGLDRDGDVGRAGRRPGAQVDGEVILGEPAAGCDGRLHLGHDVGTGCL